MKQPKVVAAHSLTQEAMRRLGQHCELRIWAEKGTIPREVLKEWLIDADGFLSYNTTRVDDDLVAGAKRLKVVAQSSVGYDNVDVAALQRRGIAYGNTPGVLVDATAELVFGLLLAAARRIPSGWDYVRSGGWQRRERFSYGVQVAGKRIGILGMGSIGAAVAERARAFRMEVLYHNRQPRKDEAVYGARYCSLQEMLATADFVVSMLPLTKENAGSLNREFFAQMKPEAFFINGARGALVNMTDLYQALQQNTIAFAALDVVEPEPFPADHPLLTLPNVLITPHIGSATAETRLAMAQLTVDNLLAGLAGKDLPAQVV